MDEKIFLYFLLFMIYFLFSLGAVALPVLLMNYHLLPSEQRKKADRAVMIQCWFWPYYLITSILKWLWKRITCRE